MVELVKAEDGYYFPREYIYFSDTGKRMRLGSEEHVNATLPTYSYDKETGKWCLTFCGADSGGYDVRLFDFYFDSEEELLSSLKGDKQ